MAEHTLKDSGVLKPYLLDLPVYRGGKSRDEVGNGQPLVKLSSNENMLGASPKALAAIQASLDLLHEYPEPVGESLNQALSAHYGGVLSPDQFITANSGIGILELIVMGFLDENTECVYSMPGFGPYFQFPAKVGAKAINVPLLAPNYELDVAGILAAVNERTRVVWVCSPNNPTGTYIPQATLDALLAGLPDDVILVFDEVYCHFAEAADYTTGLPYVLAGKNVIAVNSFSKAFGLAGLRVGYAYTTPELSDYIRRVRRPFLINTVSLEAVKAALEDKEHLDRTAAMVSDGKKWLYPQLDRLGVQYWRSEANFILIEPPMPPKDFEQRMLEKGIMVRPVAGFGAPDGVRVTVGTAEANAAYIEALEAVLAG